MVRRTAIEILALAWICAGCGSGARVTVDQQDASPLEAGSPDVVSHTELVVDASVDKGPDLTADVGPDLTVDVGPDLTVDVGPDLTVDVGPDLTVDIGPDLTADSPPLGDLGPPSGVTQIVAADSTTCALLSNGMVRCWGFGGAGRLGYGNTETIGDDETPASAGDVELGGVVVQVALGGDHGCVVLAGGQVRCWGIGFEGELGYAKKTIVGDDETPASAGSVGVGGPVRQLALGGSFTCALLDQGQVRCWGRGAYGALGYGNTDNIGDDEHPAVAGDVGVGAPVTEVVAGTEHVCALLVGGKVRCWGWNLSGELGYGHTETIGDNETPASAGDVDLGGAAVQLAAGGHHSCALLAAGNVRCWGSNTYGQLGYGNTEDIGDDETPASAGDVNLGGVALQIVAAGSRTCALLAGGKVRCWGSAWGAALGYQSCKPGGPEVDYFDCESIGDDETPASAGDVDIGGSAVQITAGDYHTCALLTTGAVRCWGWSGSGQLGYGNTETIGDDEPPAAAGDVPVL